MTTLTQYTSIWALKVHIQLMFIHGYRVLWKKIDLTLKIFALLLCFLCSGRPRLNE